MFVRDGPVMQQLYGTGIDVPLPTRVLNVDYGVSPDKIRLETELPEGGRYLALSHCWGGGIPIKTTHENFAAWERGVGFEHLPKTFQDAVTVTRDLGLKYLWIDALCIIQDDKEDWEKESGNMAAVYQNAFLVIGADMAADSEAGFLDPQLDPYHKNGNPLVFVESEKTTVYSRLHYLHGELDALFSEGSPLSKRAWTLQEQILAPRMIHFGAREILWECNSKLLCECMQLSSTELSETERLGYRRSLRSSSHKHKYKTWCKIVNSVVKRSITEPDDILPALSGLAQHFSDYGAGPYHAGLWLRDLPQGLLWETGCHHGIRPETYRAPSWSWAALVHPSVVYYSDGRLYYEVEPLYAEIVTVHTEPKGSDPFGAVASGYLTISGPVMEVMFENGHMVSPTGETNADVLIIPFFDFEQDTDVSIVHYYLFIGAMTDASWPTRGLILRRLNSTVAQYCGLTTSRHFMHDLSKASETVHHRSDHNTGSLKSSGALGVPSGHWESWFERIGVFECTNETYQELSWCTTEKTVTIV